MIEFHCACKFQRPDEFSPATLIEESECGYHASLKRAAQQLSDYLGAHDNQNMPWSLVRDARENLMTVLRFGKEKPACRPQHDGGKK
jgi:hypothetical protein